MNHMVDELLVETESFVASKYCSKGRLVEVLYTEIVEMGGRFRPSPPIIRMGLSNGSRHGSWPSWTTGHNNLM
jgi:hypothetical protein